MSNEKELNINGKRNHSIILMLILFIPMSILLFITAQFFSKKNISDQESLSTGVLNNIVSHMGTMSLAALHQYNENLGKRLDVTVSFLKEDVKNGRYTGPRLLDSGFVITLEDDEVILPEGIPEGSMKISTTLINDSIHTHAVRTGRLVINGDSAEVYSDNSSKDIADSFTAAVEGISENLEETSNNALNEEDDPADSEQSIVQVGSVSGIDEYARLEDGEYALSFSPITDEDIYVAVTSESVFSEYVALYTEDTLTALKNAAETSEGMIVLMSKVHGELNLIESYGELDGIEEFPLSSITPTMLESEESTTITINGQVYRYTWAEADASYLNAQKLYIIQVFPSQSMNSQLYVQTAMICMVMLLIFMTVIVYTLSGQRFVLENLMTKDEAARYSPRKLRRKLNNAAIIGAIAIFCFAFLTQIVGHLHQHIRYGDYTLKLVSGTVEQSVEDQTDRIRQHQEQWYADICSVIASSFNERPELVTQEKLKELSDILEADFLMVFDSTGNEYASSNDYTGFKLGRDLGKNSAQFADLLKGLPCIIHSPTDDEDSILKRQYIGVTMDAVDKNELHGALVLSLLPGQTDVAANIVDVGDEMALSLNKQTLCFTVLEETGVILESTLPSLEGRTIADCGLSESSLQGGYMDFDTIDDSHLFIVTRKSGDYIFYYATDYSTMMGENLLFSLISTLLYVITLALIIHGLLAHYDDQSYKKWTKVLLPNLPARWLNSGSNNPDVPEGEEKKPSWFHPRNGFFNKKTPQKKKHFEVFINKLFNWDNRLPEEKASLVFYIGMFLFALIWMMIILTNKEDVALVTYLLYGGWNRGLNTFSIYCIILSLAIANMIITVSTWILHMVANILSSKGETICNLIRSIIQYITIIVVIVISLSYLGVLNSTVIASLGLGSVILSLGAKDIVADILSGILIVFEQTLRIGDIVEYGGKIGMVQEVGMRTTKLELIPANDILEVRNSEIATVTNMSKYASACLLDIKIRASEDLNAVEKLINDNLTRIGDGSEDVIGIPVYMGVSMLGSSTVTNISLITLTIRFNCDQKNYMSAYYYMNKEFHYLFEENNISVY